MILRGIPSGDGECWCFLVDRETFKDITGKAPEEFDTHKGKGKYKYKLYPGHLIDQYDSGLTGQEVILSVEAVKA